jgi:hypothetical protein
MTMPIDLPQLLHTRPEIAEVRYLADCSNLLLAKSKPLQMPKHRHSNCSGREAEPKAYPAKVVGSNLYKISPLKTMLLPKHWWQYGHSELGSSEGYYLEFSPRGDRETSLTLERSFKDRESDFCRQVLETLKAPPHKIGENEGKLLEMIDSDFQAMETIDLNGRRVIIAEGTSYGNSLLYVLMFHSQSEPHGCGSIRFRASPRKYKEYIKAVKASFQSIEWETPRANQISGRTSLGYHQSHHCADMGKYIELP